MYSIYVLLKKIKLFKELFWKIMITDCWMLQNQAKATNQDKRNSRNEINLVAKTLSKNKILEMYASVIKREQAKLERIKRKPFPIPKINDFLQS
jgi:hypothetical protein